MQEAAEAARRRPGSGQHARRGRHAGDRYRRAPDASHKRDATVWLAIAKEKETVSITRGENRGRELTYHHPVRELSPVGMWKGEAMTLRLPLKDLKTMGGDCLVALVQVENSGPILGAAEYERRL